MFNISTLQTALFGQIGFLDSDDPCFDGLASTLTASATGLYYNGFHPLVTYENLQAVAPNFDGYNVSTWLTGTAYSIGDFAKLSGVVWESVTDANTGNNPSTDDGTNWKLPINDWLAQKVNASIMKMLYRLQVHKKIMESTKTLLENIQLFDGAGRFQDVITPNSRFVGLELTPKRINNISLILDYIGLQFTSQQTNLVIYVFHSSQLAAIKTQTLTTAGATSFDWIATSDDVGSNVIALDYVRYSTNLDSGGTYYIGYFEDDITGNAIKKRHQFADPPCGGCNDRDQGLYNEWNKFFDVRAIEVANGDLNGTSLWDISKIGYQEATNFGLNLSVSVKTDVTDLLVSNKSIFTNPLGYQFAYDMLQEFMNDPQARLNRLVDNATNKAAFGIQELNEKDTLKKSLDDSMAGLQFDTARLTQVLPEDRRPRMRLGTI